MAASMRGGGREGGGAEASTTSHGLFLHFFIGFGFGYKKMLAVAPHPVDRPCGQTCRPLLPRTTVRFFICFLSRSGLSTIPAAFVDLHRLI